MEEEPAGQRYCVLFDRISADMCRKITKPCLGEVVWESSHCTYDQHTVDTPSRRSPAQPHRDSMSVNSHPTHGFIHSVLEGRLTEAIVKAAAGTVGAAAGASGGGAVAALTSHGAASLVGYAIGRRSATGNTGHTRDTTGNDVGVGVYHDSNSVAAGQQQHYLKGTRGYGDDEALLTGVTPLSGKSTRRGEGNNHLRERF